MSPVEVIGNYSTITRKRSGLFSLDWALSNRQGELGVPMRTILEVYGHPETGKSTLCYYLAGVLTGKGNVSICDVENADREYIGMTMVNSGMDGVAKLIDAFDDKGKPITHEEMLQDVAKDLSDDKVGAVILDSVGMLQPLAEASGDFGEAFMGRRAKLVAQVARDFVNSLRNKERPSVALVINHVHGIMGGRGHTTAGGDTLKFAAAARIMLWPTETITRSEEDSTAIGFRVSGKTEKHRYGGKGRGFSYYIVPGYGVHVGASAMFDCFDLGLAERGATVKMDGKGFGYLKKDLLSYAETGKQRKFDPFVERLAQYEKDLDNVLSAGTEEVSDLGDGDAEVLMKFPVKGKRAKK